MRSRAASRPRARRAREPSQAARRFVAGGANHQANGGYFMSQFSINRAVLVGRLTREPELRALPSGTSVCSLRIACNASRRDAEGDYAERPQFFDVSVYGAAAESVARYMRKGSRVGVDGRLESR